jgi:hypothetical protein
MSIKGFFRTLLPTDMSFDKQVEQALPRYRKQRSEALVEHLRSCDYLHLDAATPGEPGMESSPAVQRLLQATDGGDFQALERDWSEVLNALRRAEHAAGYTGRPLLVDYDIHLSCIVRVLAERHLQDSASVE